MPRFGVFWAPGGHNAPPPTLQTYGYEVTRTKSEIYLKICLKENGLIISSLALRYIQLENTESWQNLPLK